MVERLSAGKSHRKFKSAQKVQHTFVRPWRPGLSGLPWKRESPRRHLLLQLLSSYFIYSTRDADSSRRLYANHMQRVNKWETQAWGFKVVV